MKYFKLMCISCGKHFSIKQTRLMHPIVNGNEPKATLVIKCPSCGKNEQITVNG